MVPLIHTYIVLKNKLRGGKDMGIYFKGPKKQKTKWSCSVVATMEWKQILGKGFKFPSLLKPFPNFTGALTPQATCGSATGCADTPILLEVIFFILLFSSSCCRQFFIFLFCFSLVQGSDHVVEQLFYDRIPYHKFNFICRKFKIIAYIYFDMHEFNVIFPGLLK